MVTPNKTNFFNFFLKPAVIWGMIFLMVALFLVLDLTAEFSFFKTPVSAVVFDVDPTPLAGSNLKVCTGGVTGNTCSLQPTLSWTVDSGTQVAYAVQVDDNGWLPKSPPSAFPSPEVDTGQIVSADTSYTIPAGKLAFGTTYYWQVAIKDNFGSWSGWTEADASFTTPSVASCFYTLTVSIAGSGSGTVTGTGINCPGDCSETYPLNTSVTLSASASTGSTFAGWSGSGCSGTGTCTVTMDAAKSVTATFTINTYTLTVSKAGTGSGTVTSSPSGIDCGTTCSASYNYNTSVTLTASASTGSTFSGWSGSGCSGTDTCTLTIDSAKSVTATFTLNSYTLTVAKSGTGSGSITSSPAGIDCGSTCSASYDYGTSVTLTASPSADSLFTGWSGSGCSGTGSCVISVDAGKAVTANFDAKTLAVSLDVSPSSGNIPLNSTLTATVSGTAVGTINYTFYCNRSDSGTNITTPYDAKFDGISQTTKSTTCTYNSVGTFYPKVIVERDVVAPKTDVKTATVLNRAPTVTPGSVTQPNYCVSGPAATFSWTFSDPDPGDTQSAYQVQVDNNSDFSSPEVDSGKVNSSSNSYATVTGALSYNNTYYWRVRVWDSYDLASAWASGSSFTTPKHAYPTVNFSWAPIYPSVKETVQFADQSTVYGGATKSAWLWTIPDAQYIGGTNSSSQNPKVKFQPEGAKQVTLKVTDSDGYACQTSKTVNVQLPLPEWKEVAPQ